MNTTERHDNTDVLKVENSVQRVEAKRRRVQPAVTDPSPGDIFTRIAAQWNAVPQHLGLRQKAV